MEKRLIALFCLMTLCFALLFLRVGSIAVDPGLSDTAAAQSRYTLTFGKTRGQIYDCRMRPLVDEEERYLAACLPMPENVIQLSQSSVLLGDVDALMENGTPFLVSCAFPALDIPGVQVFPVRQRSSREQLARHIVGYCGGDGSGVTGIERAFDAFLQEASRTSSITYTVDGRRQPLTGIEPEVSLAEAPVQGVVLTIDSRIQEIVETVGEKYLSSGAVVVMEPSTGKIRACASFPQYDPQDIAGAVQDTEGAPLLNRAFQAYNVGSTFKICTAAAALTQGIPSGTLYDCQGAFTVPVSEAAASLGALPQVFQCHDWSGHSWQDMRRAMMTSCNPYFIQLGLTLDKQGLLNMAQDLSFGRATEFAPGMTTASGNLPTLSGLYNPAAVANLSFGQGELTATPIQIAQMLSAVVNGGSTPSACLVEGTTEDGKLLSQREEAPLPVKAMSEQVADTLREFLVASVMEEPDQNAKPAYVTAGGKTGTAQTGILKEDGSELLRGWFAGFFPAEEPEYVVVVLAEDAVSGNRDASPVFREIADALYAPIRVSPSRTENAS